MKIKTAALLILVLLLHGPGMGQSTGTALPKDDLSVQLVSFDPAEVLFDLTDVSIDQADIYFDKADVPIAPGDIPIDPAEVSFNPAEVIDPAEVTFDPAYVSYFFSPDILNDKINNYLINPTLLHDPIISPDLFDHPAKDSRRAHLNKLIISSGFLFISGFSDGTSEVLKIKYQSFERVFPDANPQFWDYKISWTNKYRNGSPPDAAFPGAKTAFVWTTDGYHLMRMIRNSTMIVAVTIPISSGLHRNWRSYVKDGVIYYLAYTAGFNFAYDVIFE